MYFWEWIACGRWKRIWIAIDPIPGCRSLEECLDQLDDEEVDEPGAGHSMLQGSSIVIASYHESSVRKVYTQSYFSDQWPFCSLPHLQVYEIPLPNCSHQNFKNFLTLRSSKTTRTHHQYIVSMSSMQDAQDLHMATPPQPRFQALSLNLIYNPLQQEMLRNPYMLIAKCRLLWSLQVI